MRCEIDRNVWIVEKASNSARVEARARASLSELALAGVRILVFRPSDSLSGQHMGLMGPYMCNAGEIGAGDGVFARADCGLHRVV